jgi:hypothetical protein
MNPTAMHRIAHRGCHQCAPGPWHSVPNVTGDYDLDATIMHRGNRDLPNRLRTHLLMPKVGTGTYGQRTGYRSRHGNHGDD